MTYEAQKNKMSQVIKEIQPLIRYENPLMILRYLFEISFILVYPDQVHSDMNNFKYIK